MSASSVLVVEDERIVALNLQLQLNKLGYAVCGIAVSGAQALQQIESAHPDLVLMDIHLEGDADGIETAARIPPQLQIPVVYLTAFSEEAMLARAGATRPYGFLVKPVSERELHATIRMALERRQTDIALSESEERLRLALDAAEMGSWELDERDHRIMLGELGSRIFGFPRGNFVGSWEHFLNQVEQGDRALLVGEVQRVLAQDAAFQLEFRCRRDDQTAWLRAQGKVFPVRRRGGARRIVGVVQDISEQRLAQEGLRQAATVFASSRDGILILDTELRVVSANRSYCELTGFTEEELIGSRHHPLAAEGSPRQWLDDVLEVLQMGMWRGELPGRRRDGAWFPTLTHVTAVQVPGGAVDHYVAVISDLSAVRSAEQQLYYLAHHDPLTGLPNRLFARSRLEHALEQARRHGQRVALLFVDLDLFKRVNDSLGHNVGDELLRAVARRMRECVRSEDTIARLGGDEFLLIIERGVRPEDLVLIAEKVNRVVSAPIRVADTELTISASVGISQFPDNGSNSDDLIRAADTAMYAAKQKGRRCYAFYSPEMTAAMVLYMEVERDLRQALAGEQFELHYQPQVAMSDGRIVGAEALIRWRHPQRGLLGAGDIIPVAEESDLIVAIGDWVLRSACAQLDAWRKDGVPLPRVAINVSIRQMYHGRVVETVERVLREFDLPSDHLEVEITETTLQSEEECLYTLDKLNQLGVTLAVDDFGTGYSCLSSLKNLPIHRVKIDRAFVRDIPADHNAVAITEAIVAMAHRLNLQVVAEGVETGDQEQLLRACGCDEAQGYLYAKPMPAAAMTELLWGQLG